MHTSRGPEIICIRRGSVEWDIAWESLLEELGYNIDEVNVDELLSGAEAGWMYMHTERDDANDNLTYFEIIHTFAKRDYAGRKTTQRVLVRDFRNGREGDR